MFLITYIGLVYFQNSKDCINIYETDTNSFIEGTPMAAEQVHHELVFEPSRKKGVASAKYYNDPLSPFLYPVMTHSHYNF